MHRADPCVSGAFGVTTRIWLKAYPALPAINTVAGQVGCKDFESYSRLIGSLVDSQISLRDLGHYVSKQDMPSAKLGNE